MDFSSVFLYAFTTEYCSFKISSKKIKIKNLLAKTDFIYYTMKKQILEVKLVIKRPTDEMMAQLLKANNIEDYIKENQEYFVDLKVCDFLSEYIKSKKLVKSHIIKKAEISEIFGFQVLSGTRNPSRNTLLSLCIAMDMTIDEVQSTLKIAEFAPLYPKNKRDSIIISGIINQNEVCDINNMLFDNDEETL